MSRARTRARRTTRRKTAPPPLGGDETTEEELEADNEVEEDTLKTLDPEAPPA